MTSSASLSFTNGAGIGSTSSSTVSLSSDSVVRGTSYSVSTTSLSGTISTSASEAINPTLGSTETTMTKSSPVAFITTTTVSPTGSISSTRLWPTVISTTYTTICEIHPSICPTPTPTCLSTTITVLHCGCTELPEPSVPMTTTVVPCGRQCQLGTHELDSSHDSGKWNDWHELAGTEGHEMFTTLNIPCTNDIQVLQTSVEAWYQVSASAAAGQSDADQSYEAQPYTFPISFPLSGAASAPQVTATLTLALTNGSSPSWNDSDGSGKPNGTWTAATVTPSSSAVASGARMGSAASPAFPQLLGNLLHIIVLLAYPAVLFIYLA